MSAGLLSWSGAASRSAIILFGSVVLLTATAPPASSEEMLVASGGPGGVPFTARCPQDQLLAGFELRAGDDVDAVRPMCVSALGGPLTSAASPSPWHGGNGGSPRYLLCPPRIAPIVTGVRVASEGADTQVVNAIALSCGAPDGAAPSRNFEQASFQATTYRRGFGEKYATGADDSSSCPPGQVAIGAHGRSGSMLDALGLICGMPTIGVHSIGRANPAAPAQPPRPICDAAADARARNSPAAPALEARCRALQKE